MNKELQFLIYNTPREDIKVNVVMRDETIWLTQRSMAELFGIDRTGIGKHLKNIFSSGELEEALVCANFAHTTQHGAMEGKTQTKETQFYNLYAIISVGYRVNSKKATHFRIWATKILKDFIQKGFVLDDDRLKQGETVFGKDYFRDCWIVCAPSVPVSAASGSKSPMFSLNAALIMIKTPRSPGIFMAWCRINSTLRSSDKPLRRLFTPRRIKGRTI